MKEKNDFDALLDELNSLESTDELTKAMPGSDTEMDDEKKEDEEDDKKIQAASDGDEETLADTEGYEEEMGKSMIVETESGEKIEAFDGTALVKALRTRMDSSESVLKKALGTMINALEGRDKIINQQSEILKSQGKLIKSLQDNVLAIADSGKGRKTVLSIHEKQTTEQLKKSEGIPVGEFRQLLKSAAASGAINAMEAGHAETALNSGVPVSETTIAKIAAAK